MPKSSTPATWELESFQLSQNTAYVIGWLFVPGERINGLSLQLRTPENGGKEILVGRIVLDAGKPRPDVYQVHQAHPEALESGFVGLGAWPRQPRHGDRLVLSASLGNGESISIEIPSARWHWSLCPTAWQQRTAAIRQLLRYGKRALRLLVSGQIASLREKLTRQLGEMPQKSLPPRLTEDDLVSLGANQGTSCNLIIDHRLGGGANHYRMDEVKRWLKQGNTVFTLTYHLARLQPMLIVETRTQQLRFGLEKASDLLPTLSAVPLSTITYNTAVSFVGAEEIPELVLRLKQQHQARLTVLLHDYFSICPSHFLINANGEFCNIPDLESCRRCLPNNRHGFTSLFQGDVAQWRAAWGPMLQQADEIIAFSHSSIELLKRAYRSKPGEPVVIREETITVQPHSVDYIDRESLIIKNRDQLIIGIVGQIGFHKGAAFIQALAQEIEQQGAKERIAVIGSLEGRCNPAIVRQSGPYRREDLARTILESGANIMLFPSIWPETFSYVTQEIIQFDLPLACFSYGAPAERVKQYEKGLVLESQDPSDVLESLRQLFQDSYHMPASAQDT